MPVKQKKCRSCKELFSPRNSLQAVCGFLCAKEYGKADPNAADREFKRETRRMKKELNENNFSYQKKKLQEEFNKAIRVRDFNDGCISCDGTKQEIESKQGWKTGGCWDCGHYLAVGSHEELRFRPDNAHKQCKSCNGGAGNYTRKNHQTFKDYKVNLIEKIGPEKVEWLEGPHELARLRLETVKDMRKHYRAQIKKMEQQIENGEKPELEEYQAEEG